MASDGDHNWIRDLLQITAEFAVTERCLKSIAEEMLKLRQEHAETDAQLEAKKEEQILKDLQQRREELEEERERRNALYGAEMPAKEKEVARTVKKAEADWQEVVLKDAEIERMKRVLAGLNERHQKIKVSVRCSKKASDVTECALKMTEKPFKDGQELLSRLESLLITRDKLHQRCNELREEADQQRGELQKVLQQHRMFQLGKTTQVSKLETELDQAFCDAQTWERRWGEIETTALKKTLEQHNMKMAILSMYERIGGKVGEKGVALNDTVTQLEKMKVFIQDHRDIVEQCQTTFLVDEEKAWMKTKKRRPLQRQ
ncbi:coiled-coil domain-containing protein 42 homolog [Genypterus blacodes]|uniref:coiled-coil domain-containing protein 42 homolog n=1 Tax=Genypterus blacodes TaxID=154954 RepID=UPI003F76BD98